MDKAIRRWAGLAWAPVGVRGGSCRFTGFAFAGGSSCPQGMDPLFSGAAQDGEKGQREHRQRHMPIPGVIEPELVLVETGFLLGGLETLLRRPNRAKDWDPFR